MDLKGRCISCGFLAKHSIEHAPSYYEIEQSERDVGRAWHYSPETGGVVIRTEPDCFRHVISIRDEIRQIRGNDADTSGPAKQVLSKDRQCESWYPYIPGFGPKEHAERLQMEQLEERRMNFELAIETQRQDFEMKLSEMSQNIQKSNQKVANRFTVAMIVLTLVQIFVALDWGRATFRQWVDQLGNLLIQKLSGG